MKKVDLTNVQEAGESRRLPAGAYICKITTVTDIPEKEYLKVAFDIDQGEYKGYYAEIRKNHPDWEWVGLYVKSYKPAALPMFKRFCSAVSRSNGNFVFDGGSVNADETTLVNKSIGLVLRDEEYYSNSGDLKTRLIVHSEFPVDKLADQKVPEPKRVEKVKPTTTEDFMSIPAGAADEVPW